MSERNLRLALICIMSVTLLLPSGGVSNCFFAYWYSMEILSHVPYSFDNIILTPIYLLYLLAVPILLLLNILLSGFVIARGFKRFYRSVLLTLLCPLMWLGTFYLWSGGPLELGFLANLAAVTAAALVEIVLIIRERQKEPEDVGSANDHSGTVPMRSKEHQRVASSTLVVLTWLSLVVLPIFFGLLLAGWRSITYAYFWRLVSRRQDEYEALNAQVLEELPEYPGAELIYVLEASNVFDLDFRSHSLDAPAIDVFYGLKGSVSEREILSYLGTSLGNTGWQASREIHNWFTKDKQCVLVHTYSGELPAPLLSEIPTEYRDTMAQYDTLYKVAIMADADAIEGLPPFPQWIRYDLCP